MRRPLLWLFLAAQVILLMIEVATRYDTNGRQGALALTNIMAIVAVLLWDRSLSRKGIRLSAITLLCVAAAVWLDALGNFQHWYGAYWWWDRITHAMGGMALSALLIDVWRAKANTLAGAVWTGFVWGQFVGALYEISEYLGDLWFNTHRIGGSFDSPRDLMFNLAGGLIVAGLYFAFVRSIHPLRSGSKMV